MRALLTSCLPRLAKAEILGARGGWIGNLLLARLCSFPGSDPSLSGTRREIHG
jgi:hypothetical protein